MPSIPAILRLPFVGRYLHMIIVIQLCIHSQDDDDEGNAYTHLCDITLGAWPEMFSMLFGIVSFMFAIEKS